MLALRGLGKDYGARTAVKSLSLDVARGECVGLLGPNGAGKTTTISMICGVLTPTRGTVTLDGADVHDNPFMARAKLGLVPQELALYEELTAVQNLRYAGALYGLSGAVLIERMAWVLDVVGLGNRAREPVTNYSGGMKRRLNLAAGLLHKPQLLVLDEPTVGVDAQSRRHIADTVRSLRQAGTTILYTSHYFEEVEALCDRVVIIDHGELVTDGHIRDVIAAHGGARVAIDLTGDDATVAAATQAASAHGSVERLGQRLHIKPSAGLGPLVAAIEGTGARIEHVATQSSNLEAAFLALTGHALRDAP